MDSFSTDMTYSGLTYTTPYGKYVVPHSNALTFIGKHTFPSSSRQSSTTIIDPGIKEAYDHYPNPRPWSDFENFSRSYYTEEGHQTSLDKFASSERSPRLDNTSQRAVDAHCFELFSSFPRVHSLDFKTQLKQVPFEPTSSAGVGLTGKKGDEGNLSRACGQASATLHRFISGDVQAVIENSAPDRAFVRTQLADLSKSPKIRHVFGQAFQYILLEGLSCAPLLQMFMTQDTPYFIGIDPRKGVPELIERLAARGLDLMSSDWHGYDQTVEHWEAEDTFNLLESIIDFPNPESRAAFLFSKIFFINRKIAGPFGNLFFKHRGVPSGSYFTNLADSWINYRRFQYMYHRITGSILDTDHCRFTGDDALLGLPRNLNLNPYHFEQICINDYPLIWFLSADKMKFGRGGDTVDFLQRELWIGDHKRDNDRVERLSMFPEYSITDIRISAYRARALWEDGNYESAFLAFATAYLEHKYGVLAEHEVPQHVRRWRDKVLTPLIPSTIGI